MISIDKKGFSLIEILLVIFFMTTLSVLTTVNYRDFERVSDLSASASEVVTVLQLAQTRTVSSDDDSAYGVHFNEDSYVLFKGDLYDEFDENNEVYFFPDTVEYWDVLGYGINVDIIFDRVTGATYNSGYIDLRLVDDNSQTRTIQVLPSGQVGLLGFTEQEYTRVTDSRHVHFNFNWSIQGANDLEFYFPSPDDVTEVIDMNDFFVNPNEFAWAGAIDVNGESQSFRIHTHYLDGFNTYLCVHRDGELNTKAVEISIDDKDIVSIDLNGVPTVGFYGGNMLAQ